MRFLFAVVGPAISLSIALGLGKTGGNFMLQASLGGAALFLAAALVMLAIVYWPRNFYRPPDPLPFSQEYLGVPLIDTKLMMLDTIAAAYDLNSERLDTSWLIFKIAFMLFLAAAILG